MGMSAFASKVTVKNVNFLLERNFRNRPDIDTRSRFLRESDLPDRYLSVKAGKRGLSTRIHTEIGAPEPLLSDVSACGTDMALV